MKMKKLRIFGNKKALIMVICMLAAGICYSCGGKAPDGEKNQVLELEEEGGDEAADKMAGEITVDGIIADGIEGKKNTDSSENGYYPKTDIKANDKTDVELEATTLLCVHICGSVKQPGVYELPAGSRVYEAVDAAGGFAEDAAVDYLNLAEEISDAMRIEVPDKEQVRAWQESGKLPRTVSQSGGKILQSSEKSGMTSPAPVNLNRATKEELMTLKGVGQSRAEAIVRYREEFGGFQTIEDIMNVPGIKEGAFEKIKDSITV